MGSYYNSIDDLPLKNWLKISAGELDYCRTNKKKGSKELDEKHSDIIKDEYYKLFGFSTDYVQLLELQEQLIIARMDWVITEDNFIKNKINRLELEIEEFVNNKDGGDISKTIISLSKWAGYRLDVNVITVREFYNMIDMFKEEAESHKKKLANGTGEN